MVVMSVIYTDDQRDSLLIAILTAVPGELVSLILCRLYATLCRILYCIVPYDEQSYKLINTINTPILTTLCYTTTTVAICLFFNLCFFFHLSHLGKVLWVFPFLSGNTDNFLPGSLRLTIPTG